MKLLSNGLARHQPALADKQSTFSVKCSTRKDNLLRSIFQHLALSLLQEAKKEANNAGA